jgi:MtN3 and saliva related transmembrane protein
MEALSISLPTIIGLVAGCLSSWSLVPQLVKCWREGLTEAVSKKMFATRAFGLILWCVYGFFAGSIPVVIFSSINLVLSITILVLTLRNSRAAAAHAVQASSVPGPAYTSARHEVSLAARIRPARGQH